MKKNIFAYGIMAVCIAFTSVVTSCSKDDDNTGDSVEMTGFDITSSDVLSLIKEDEALIAKQGYGNLVIPRNINKIDLTKIAAADDALWVCAQLDSAGYKAYLVGGAIRDLVIGKDADDFDVVTDANLEQMTAIFGDKLHTHKSGEKIFEGVKRTESSVSTDLADYQECPEAYIQKGYVAKANVTKSLLGDSFERDLPFNALYYEPSTGNLYDFHGGLADIRDKKISAMVPDADVELTTDPAVVIRALRFQAKFDYTLSDNLESSLKDKGLEYMKLYPNNILMGNLAKMFFDGYGLKCYNSLVNHNIFDYCFPIISEIKDRAAYNTWVAKEIKDLDAREEAGETVTYGYPIALITYPMYKQLVDGGKTAEEAAEYIFTVQENVMEIWDSNKTDMKGVWDKMYKAESSSSAKTFRSFQPAA